jgi:hypothetical protein
VESRLYSVEGGAIQGNVVRGERCFAVIRGGAKAALAAFGRCPLPLWTVVLMLMFYVDVDVD